MPIRELVLFPDRGLLKPCDDIVDFGPSLHDLVTDLKDTLYGGPGVGLAAPQIGVSKRISVIHIRSKKNPQVSKESGRGFYVIVNPVLLSGEGMQIPREGCLSIPDLLANVRRYQQVTVRALNERGEEQTIRAEGFEALALQHEIDHLNGKLFLDRVANLKTDVFRRKTY